MEYKKWEFFYKQIIADFGFDEDKDVESAKILDSYLIERQDVSKLKDLINNKVVVVFGAGPSLEELIAENIDRFHKACHDHEPISESRRTLFRRQGVTGLLTGRRPDDGVQPRNIPCFQR